MYMYEHYHSGKATPVMKTLSPFPVPHKHSFVQTSPEKQVYYHCCNDCINKILAGKLSYYDSGLCPEMPFQCDSSPSLYGFLFSLCHRWFSSGHCRFSLCDCRFPLCDCCFSLCDCPCFCDGRFSLCNCLLSLCDCQLSLGECRILLGNCHIYKQLSSYRWFLNHLYAQNRNLWFL